MALTGREPSLSGKEPTGRTLSRASRAGVPGMAEGEISRQGGHAVVGVLEEMAELYERVYAEPPYNSAPRFSRDRFVGRTREQSMSSDFVLVTARRDGRLAGFTFGFTMPPGAWWGGASRPSEDVLGSSKFAVIELMVDRPYRRRGIGQGLLAALLRDRPEPYATLVAVLRADAYGWYLRNGWRKEGEFRIEPPFSDALVRDLKAPLRPS
jgi:GNAT superfamily N-acetyltransferase